MELEELVRAAQRGDPLAMSALLRAVAPYVGRICGSIALADGDDAMQETMIQALKHLRSLREPAALQGWLRRIAVREALKLARAAPGRSRSSRSPSGPPRTAPTCAWRSSTPCGG